MLRHDIEYLLGMPLDIGGFIIVFLGDIVRHGDLVSLALAQFREQDVSRLAALIKNYRIWRGAEQIDAVRLLGVARIVVFRDNHVAHLLRRHRHRINLREERFEVEQRRHRHSARRQFGKTDAAVVVESDVGTHRAGDKRSLHIGKSDSVERDTERTDVFQQIGIALNLRHTLRKVVILTVAVERNIFVIDTFYSVAFQPDAGRTDHPQLVARLPYHSAVHERIDHVVGVSADNHVVTVAPLRKLYILRFRHVRQQYENLAAVPVRCGCAGSLHRVGKFETLENLVVAVGMPVIVIGYHADEADAHAVVGLYRNTRAHVHKIGTHVLHVGAHDVEIGILHGIAQESRPAVELVVAERRGIIAEFVHQVVNRTPPLRQIDERIARPAVARIDKHRGDSVAALLDGFGKPCEIGYVGVNVVGREYHHLALAQRRAIKQYARKHRHGEQQRNRIFSVHRFMNISVQS